MLVIDRLGAGYLGPYGATWLDTPAFNRLASQSLVIEHALSDSPDLARGYRSFWTGRHADMPEEVSPSLAEALSAKGYHTICLTDSADVVRLPWAAGFREVVQTPRRVSNRPATDVEQTHMARMVDATMERFARLSSPFLFWVHLEAMQGPWDAPWELRAQWADEDDPPPPDFLDPPVRQLPLKFDPDEQLGVIHAYAGQIAALDRCLAWLLHAFQDSSRAHDTLLVVTSPRGYPLGEHRRIGPVDNALHGELLRVPLMLRFPDGAQSAHRAQAIAQPPDLFATLLDWAQVIELPPHIWGRSLAPLAQGEDWPRDRAMAVHGSERALRTPAWFLRTDAAPEENDPKALELYVKPDDQWEANEVSSRLPETVEQMRAALENFEQAVQAGDDALLAALSEMLREGTT